MLLEKNSRNIIAMILLLGVSYENGETKRRRAPINLLIKLPTRSRPQQFFEVLEAYQKNLSGKTNTQFLISCDLDDYLMNHPAIRSRLRKFSNVTVKWGYSSSKVDAINRDIAEFSQKNFGFDILLVASDDTIPAINGFDKLLADAMLSNFPDLDGIINFNDGNVGPDINTIPVIGRKYYERFGYIYHPSYNSFFCDVELACKSKILNKEFYLEENVICHLHPKWTKRKKDELYKKNQKKGKKDKGTFKKRNPEIFAS